MILTPTALHSTVDSAAGVRLRWADRQTRDKHDLPTTQPDSCRFASTQL